MSRRLLDAGDRAGLQGLVAYAIDKWTHVQSEMRNRFA
jgi:hypothetical protein